MSRTTRLLGLTTALVLSSSTLVVAGPSAYAADGAAGLDTMPSAGVVAGPHRLPGSDTAAPSLRTRWPVGFRTGRLGPEQGVTPAGDPSQNFASVSVRQSRAASTIQADIRLAAAPTAETDSRLRIAFGHVVQGETGAVCTSSDSSTFDIHSFDVNGTGTSRNPAYSGAHVVLKPARVAVARNAAWNCAYALLMNADGSTLYDAYIGRLEDHIQKPKLSFVVANKKLKRNGYTRIPLKIHNSASTIAAAPAVRLTVKTKGVSVRVNKKVGGIKPGATKRSAFYVKDTRRGNGVIVFTAVSGGYRKSIRLVVRELR
ncbi:hypothetical protein BH11ACT8_BH11ACT8_30960 [soil metagenome]